MTLELDEAHRLLAEGDAPGAVRTLRPAAETAPLSELAAVVERAATIIGFDDLAAAAHGAVSAPEDPVALFHFGSECGERGLSFLAVPVLRTALGYAPGAPAVLTELAYALECEYRHGEAVDLLAEHDSALRPWPHRYLLVFNAVLAGDIARAREQFSRLPEPEDAQWQPAYERVRDMLRRAEIAAGATALDQQDLRGWHFVLTGGYLATLSPYGFTAGMVGRWAYTQDSVERIGQTLDRLALVLAATDRHPRTVALLPGRDDRIVGLAAADLLGIPAVPYTPESTDTLVVAYDLRTLDETLEPTLRERADGRILYEHATCWTTPPLLNADISGFLHQTNVEPWGESLRIGDNGPETTPPDERPEAEIAAEIRRADGTPDPGDGDAPPDPDDVFTSFVAATRGAWPTGPRFAIRSPGPVRSSYFH
ncbi:hypothetical protein HLB23_16705 [Nocardia uniformis]|uniref:Uncharacterized protein n=1 Tax=Nocardia uniformis TaxID=53432 RepID=A0A849BYX2_9NOCA|nr:hypothetical protein [Nocardia uniformis]NNH71484.1 hypothetical protein [Nocardia uniformis]